jgi:DNA-repair protein XRCC1
MYFQSYRIIVSGPLAFSQDWISESHKQRKLVDIEPYLMHAGKPWRKNMEPVESDQGNR